jgi:transcriptional regulator with XRE-family HTH domain
MPKSMEMSMSLPKKLPLERIRERRKALGLSQDDLAEMTGCLQTQISRYENNEALPMSDALEALARALAVSADWLLGITDVQSTISRESELSSIELSAINALRKCAPKQKQKIVNILQQITELNND